LNDGVSGKSKSWRSIGWGNRFFGSPSGLCLCALELACSHPLIRGKEPCTVHRPGPICGSGSHACQGNFRLACCYSVNSNISEEKKQGVQKVMFLCPCTQTHTHKIEKEHTQPLSFSITPILAQINSSHTMPILVTNN